MNVPGVFLLQCVEFSMSDFQQTFALEGSQTSVHKRTDVLIHFSTDALEILA